MESSNADETDETTLGMPALSEVLGSTIPSSPSNTGDTAFPDADQFNRFPKRGRSAPNLVLCMESIPAPLLDRLDHPVRTSGSMSASNSEANPDPGQDADDPLPMSASNSEGILDHGQDPDNPLPNLEDANAAQPGDTAEHYVPWLGHNQKNAGLIPMLLLWFGPVSTGSMVLLISLLCLSVGMLFGGVIRTRSWGVAMEVLTDLFFNAYFALINWFPILLCGQFLILYPKSNRLTSRMLIVVAACLFVFFSWAYCAIVSTEKEGPVVNFGLRQHLQTWSTGLMPQSFKGCDARVEPEQASLFNTDIYYVQFARMWYNAGNNTHYNIIYTPSDMERFRSIQANQTLCGQGFEGNSDLYGLGIRISLYLQWLSSLLTNNFLPETRQQIQNLYLVSSFAVCLATIIASFVKTCVFSIEIEVLYWMYWGGYICVFGSAPCPVRLGSAMKWIKLDWTTMILFTTHALMIYDGAWFVCYAYDQVFSRMPCGTYHFFFYPILDPSQGFWTLRDYVNHMLGFFIPALVILFPFVGLVSAAEVKDTVQHSAIFEFLFPKATISDRNQPQTTEQNASVKTSPGLGNDLFIARPYRKFRGMLNLPSHSRGGIRLVTPIDIRDRRLYRIRWAATGLLSYILSIVGIEVILKWNKVTGDYSLVSGGQYVPLIMGIGGFLFVSWTLVKQEIERSRNLKRRQVANQNEDDIELESLSHNLRDAISHAFSQPDIGFSTNGGAFPITSGEENEHGIRSLNNTRQSPNIEFLMSGALGSDSDLEAQISPTS